MAEGAAKPAQATTGPFNEKLEKQKLCKKLEALNKTNNDARVKWWSFCKVHAEGNITPTVKELFFLETFFAAFEEGEIEDEPGCPFKQGGGATDLADRRLFVGGLPKGCTEQDIRNIFEPFGGVSKIEIKMDESGMSRGFGFVNMEDAEAAKFIATTNKDHNTINGKWIDVKLAGDSQPQANALKGKVLTAADSPTAAQVSAQANGWGKGGGGSTPYGKGGKGKGKDGDSWGKGGGGGESWGNGGGDSWGGAGKSKGGKDGSKGYGKASSDFGSKGGDFGSKGGFGKDSGKSSFGKDNGKGKGFGKGDGKKAGFGKKGGGFGGDSWGGGGGGW